MNKLIFNRTATCEVDFISNVFDTLAGKIDLKRGSKIAIITSINLGKAELNMLENSLNKAGYKPFIYCVRDGEEAKSLSQAEEISIFLQQNLFSRQDVILNVGGGTICDLGAFVASVYMRGIRYINLPTTILCAVDACVGGKSAIDVGGAKNIWGSFYQPYKVFIDADYLLSLPSKLLSEGISEVVKYGVIDKDFGDYLTSLGNLNAIGQNLKKIIERCIQIKCEIVCQDELDYSKRRLLNAGHTVAHALECLSKFTISHANAVALGLKKETEISYKLGLISKDRYNYILNLLNNFTQQIEFEYNNQSLILEMMLDKKNSNDKISFILPNENSVEEILLTKEQIKELI